MTNLQAAIGLAQLERLDEFVAMKRLIGHSYTKLLGESSNIQLPIAQTPYAQNIYWVYGVVLKDKFPLDAKAVMEKLSENKIGTRPFFYPMHRQPIFNKMGFFQTDSHPNSERIAEQGFYIPSGIGISDEQIQKVANSLLEIIRE